jgi:hypothetical protein
MKVLFLNAPQPERDQRAMLNKLSRIPPLHLGYLASVLEKTGSEVQIVDLTLVEDGWMDTSRRAILDFAPHMVGISSTTASFPTSPLPPTIPCSNVPPWM